MLVTLVKFLPRFYYSFLMIQDSRLADALQKVVASPKIGNRSPEQLVATEKKTRLAKELIALQDEEYESPPLELAKVTSSLSLLNTKTVTLSHYNRYSLTP
jgi:hypothetical protein